MVMAARARLSCFRALIVFTASAVINEQAQILLQRIYVLDSTLYLGLIGKLMLFCHLDRPASVKWGFTEERIPWVYIISCYGILIFYDI
ncbi:hypothetical protein CCL24_14785 [Pseudomonas congelans]|nr:hypothetical protein CCL24_14785 [Pseudomonas congelans]PBQ01237.1 hypothetical protein CCL07_17225 [Pseudomonas congelans]